MAYKISEIIQSIENLQNPVFQGIVKNIKEGTFYRDLSTKDYKDRVLYTKELRNFVYNPSILNVIFTDKEIKELFFKTFGYKGNLDFTIYPNCWLRDLPLLNIGKGVYLGDGILLGTNQIEVDQEKIKVGFIDIGDKSIFDQRCAIGLNTSIGKNCVLSYQASVGLKNKIGNAVKVGANSTIGHGTKIGNEVTIADFCKIGSFVIIDEGLKFPEFTNIPSFSHVTKEGVFNRKQRYKMMQVN